MAQTVSGLSSGLDTNAIISQLVGIERRSQNVVKARASRAQVQLTNYQAVRGLLTSARTAGQALLRNIDWRSLSATSSAENVATVSAGSGTVTGSVEFSVDSLASVASSRSANVLAGMSATVARDSSIFVAAGGRSLGLATMASDDTLALGSHTVTVTQASAAATKVGTGAPAGTTVIDGSNQTLDLEVNGTSYSLTLAAGSYTAAQLATALNSAATTAGAAVTASVDSQTGALKLATNREGSAATLQVTGGTALAALALTTDGAAITGTDGKVKVGSAAEVTIASVEAGASATISAGTGSITAVFSGGLRTGSITGKNVSTGDRSLAAVVANINGASAGVTAAAVQVGSGQYRLQFSATASGAGNAPNLAVGELSDDVGSLVTLSEGTDAQITVGSGPGAYSITNASNTITDLLPGVSVTLKSKSTTPVVIAVSRDTAGIAAKIDAMVSAVNNVREGINQATKYDPETKVASPLTGDTAMRRLVDDLSRALTNATSWTTPGSPGLAGLSVDKTGKFSFDRAKFTTAFNSDPEAMARVFTQGGTATSAAVSFVSANDRAVAGTYDVVVTAPATQATSTGLVGSWPIGSSPALRFKVGSKEVSYTVGGTDTAADVANELNARFSAGGLGLVASAEGGGVQVKAQNYGSTVGFDADWGSGYSTIRGTDVAGTINGVAGVGSGQQLAIAFDHPTLGGLALNITAGAAGALGTFTYQPGLAQRLTSAISGATDSVTGYLSSSEKAAQSRIKFVNESVDRMEQRLVQYEARLRKQFANLETTLSGFKNTSGYLSGQLSGLGG